MMKQTISLAFALLLVSFSAIALPRFASRNGMSCQSCHVNPNGGGMRSPFGLSYGRDDVTIPTWQEEYSLDDFSTKLTDFISYGLDFRFLYFYQKRDNPDTTRSSFFPMQADMYLNVAISKKVSVYANPAFGLFSRYEIFGLAKVLPVGGYVKVGRFAAPYGLRLDDHTSFVREATPFRNNAGQQTGIEIGFSPGNFYLLGAVTNGLVGDRVGSGSRAAFMGRVEGRWELGFANVLVGGAGYIEDAGGTTLDIFSGYGALTFFEKLTLIADYEQIKGNWNGLRTSGDRNLSNALGVRLRQRALLVEVDYLVTPGIDLKVMYDFFDPDTKFKTGSATRYSFGFEVFPVSGVEVRPLLRFTDDTVLKRKTTDFHVLFHFYL